MSLWILDTDHASLFLSGNQSVIAQVAKHSSDIAITVITVQELFNGWTGRLNDPTQVKNISHLYAKLWKTTEFFKVITILNFDKNAEDLCQALQQHNRALTKRRIEKDLRIASIALARNATIVTRNYKDFSQIPDLKIENWVP